MRGIKMKITIHEEGPSEKQVNYFKRLFERMYGEEPDEVEVYLMTKTEISYEIDKLKDELGED